MGPIRDLLEREPALLAVPETAIKRFRINRVTVEVHETMGAPLPDRERLVRGHVDFSPAGAALYRGIAAEWLGPDWEDALDVSNTYFCEEHLYCESNDELRYAVTEHTLNGESIISSRVLPIGPWCVYWWQQFPAGYRLETQFCSSAAKTLDPTLVDS
jgi:hypothetical protein